MVIWEMMFLMYVFLLFFFNKLEKNEKILLKIDIKIFDLEMGWYWLCLVVKKVKLIEFSCSYFVLLYIYIIFKDKFY